MTTLNIVMDLFQMHFLLVISGKIVDFGSLFYFRSQNVLVESLPIEKCLQD